MKKLTITITFIDENAEMFEFYTDDFIKKDFVNNAFSFLAIADKIEVKKE